MADRSSTALAVDASFVDLPPPRFCVRPLHHLRLIRSSLAMRNVESEQDASSRRNYTAVRPIFTAHPVCVG